MNKVKKKALRTGVDEFSQRLEYYCPHCNMLIPLGARRCPECKKRRPADAYERSLELREFNARQNALKGKASPADYSATKLPMPKAPCYSSPDTRMLQASCFATDALQQLGIPKFYSSDEYGRVFEMPISYKPLPVSGPVPVPAPSVVVQTQAINVPVNFSAGTTNNNIENM